MTTTSKSKAKINRALPKSATPAKPKTKAKPNSEKVYSKRMHWPKLGVAIKETPTGGLFLYGDHSANKVALLSSKIAAKKFFNLADYADESATMELTLKQTPEEWTLTLSVEEVFSDEETRTLHIDATDPTLIGEEFLKVFQSFPEPIKLDEPKVGYTSSVRNYWKKLKVSVVRPKAVGRTYLVGTNPDDCVALSPTSPPVGDFLDLASQVQRDDEVVLVLKKGEKIWTLTVKVGSLLEPARVANLEFDATHLGTTEEKIRAVCTHFPADLKIEQPTVNRIVLRKIWIEPGSIRNGLPTEVNFIDKIGSMSHSSKLDTKSQEANVLSMTRALLTFFNKGPVLVQSLNVQEIATLKFFSDCPHLTLDWTHTHSKPGAKIKVCFLAEDGTETSQPGLYTSWDKVSDDDFLNWLDRNRPVAQRHSDRSNQIKERDLKLVGKDDDEFAETADESSEPLTITQVYKILHSFGAGDLTEAQAALRLAPGLSKHHVRALESILSMPEELANAIQASNLDAQADAWLRIVSSC